MQDTLDPDIYFLLKCCKPNLNNNDINSIFHSLYQKEESYDRFIKLAYKHGIVPLIYKNTKNLHQSSLILTKFIDKLKPHYQTIAQRNMLMSAELIYITKFLKTNHIESLACKGPALSQMAYGDITLRQYGDIDILIRKKDRHKMMLILEEKGYIPEIQLKENSKEIFFNTVNVIAFYKKSTGTRIEIHWELLSKNYAMDWKEEILWKNTKFIQINNSKIQVLTMENHLLYICVHSAKHLYERIEWICDIDRLIQSNQNINWQYILKEARRMGITRMLYLGLTLCKELFDLTIPEDIQKKIQNDKKIPTLINKIIKINFSKSKYEEKSFNTLILLLNMRENYIDKLKLLYKAIITPKFDDFLFLQLPKQISFLYPLVRLFRLIKKYSKW